MRREIFTSISTHPKLPFKLMVNEGEGNATCRTLHQILLFKEALLSGKPPHATA